MKIMDMDRVLLLKYSDFKLKDSFQKHIDVLNEFGEVWFGKMGKSPTNNTFKRVSDGEHYRVIFRSGNKSFFCLVDRISEQKSDSHYPEYYNEHFYDKNNKLSVYFRIKEVYPLERGYLKDFVITSTGFNAIETVNKSMSSMFIVHANKDIDLTK